MALITGGARGGGADAKLFTIEAMTVVISEVLDEQGGETTEGAVEGCRDLRQGITDEAGWGDVVPNGWPSTASWTRWSTTRSY